MVCGRLPTDTTLLLIFFIDAKVPGVSCKIYSNSDIFFVNFWLKVVDCFFLETNVTLRPMIELTKVDFPELVGPIKTIFPLFIY